MHPATVIKAGPVRRRAGEERADRRLRGGAARASSRRRRRKVNKPLAGHYKKANVPPTRVRREVKLAAGGEAPKAGRPGARVDLRRRRARGRDRRRAAARASRASSSATTSPAARRPTGRCSIARPDRSAPRRIPSRVVKGMRAAGRMGGERVTMHNLKVLRVDPDNHLLIVEGGDSRRADGGYVVVRKAVTAKPIKVRRSRSRRRARSSAGGRAMHSTSSTAATRRSARSRCSDEVFGGRVKPS